MAGNKRVTSGLICLLWLLVPLLSSCGQESASVALRIASSPWPGYEPLYLAKEIGYLPPSRATIYELPSSDITLESFRNRSADIATLTLDEVMELLQGGVKLRILLALDTSNGADAVMASPAIKTLPDLKGKRIAILNIPLGVYMLSRTLDAAGLRRDDVQVFPAAESVHGLWYRQGKADAFITFDPFKSELQKMGAHVLFDSSRIPNEIFDLMVVHEDVYLQRRDEVCDIARQWFRAHEYMQAEPGRAASQIAKRLGVTADDYRGMVAGIRTPTRAENLQLLSGDAPGLLLSAKRLNEVMLQEGQLKRRVDLAPALDGKLETCIGS